MGEIYFLKLGGSLITDKDREATALIPQIDALALQVKHFLDVFSDVHLLLGHGSGSFGHMAANRYHTRSGVHSSDEWLGFAEVWAAARALNQIVLERFTQIGLPVVSFPLSAAAVTQDGDPANWNTRPIAAALEHGLLPVVYGDVVLDDVLGGTILSTEEQFAALVPVLRPQKLFLAGHEAGVWQDFPACTRLIPAITPATYPALAQNIFGSASVDVTGGMASKVSSMLHLIEDYPHLQVTLFSGLPEGAVFQALSGKPVGTVLRSA